MSETIEVANAGRSDITLPCGTRLPAGASVPVAVERLREHAGHPVVRHWFDERVLRPDGPLPGPAPAGDACDCVAVCDRLRVATEDARRLAAERDVARDAVEVAHADLETLKAVLADMQALLTTERTARAEADELARLATEEADTLRAAAAEKGEDKGEAAKKGGR